MTPRSRAARAAFFAGCALAAVAGVAATRAAAPPPSAGTALPWVNTAPGVFEGRGRQHAVRFDRGGAAWSVGGAGLIQWGFGAAGAPQPEGTLNAAVYHQLSDGRFATSSAHAKLRYRIEAGGELWAQPRQDGLTWGITLPAASEVTALAFTYEGVDAVALGAGGGLEVHTPEGTLRESGLRCYQEAPERQVEVPCGYRDLVQVAEGRWTYALWLGARDPRRPLIVDPILSWEARRSATGKNQVLAVAEICDSIYLGGVLSAPGFDVPDGGTFDGGTYVANTDGFLARLQGDGGLRWLTYVGGSQNDEIRSLALGPSGELYVGGQTASQTFLGNQATGGGPYFDGFIAEFDRAGAPRWDVRLKTPTSSPGEAVNSVVSDQKGGVYFVGTALPDLSGAVNDAGGDLDAVVGQVSDAGVLLWVRYLGDAGLDEGASVYFAGASGLYAGGTTTGSGKWTTRQAGPGGGKDGWVARLNPVDRSVMWSTTIGGSNSDGIAGVLHRPGEGTVHAVGIAGNDFPRMDGGSFGNGNPQALLVKLDFSGNSMGGRLIDIALFGGNATDELSVLTHDVDNLWAAGWTNSTTFPAGLPTYKGIGPGGHGNGEYLVARLNPFNYQVGELWVFGDANRERALALSVGDRRVVVGGFSEDAGAGVQDAYAAAFATPTHPIGVRDRAFCLAYDGYSLIPPPAPDAGTEEDGGLPSGSDAGTPGQDAGAPHPPGEPRSAYGWSCGATASAPLWLAAVLLLARGRRSRRS